MLEYKTITIPSLVFDDITKKEFRKGLKKSTIEQMSANIDATVVSHSKEGWALHSVSQVSQRVRRQKSLMEKLLGWIPLIGGWIFPTMKQEVYEGEEIFLYLLTFVKEI